MTHAKRGTTTLTDTTRGRHAQGAREYLRVLDPQQPEYRVALALP